MFGWVEAYTTFSMGDYAKVRDVLGASRIKYHLKFKDMLGGWGRQISLGMNMEYSTQYYIYVKKADLADAQYLIHKALHG